MSKVIPFNIERIHDPAVEVVTYGTRTKVEQINVFKGTLPDAECVFGVVRGVVESWHSDGSYFRLDDDRGDPMDLVMLVETEPKHFWVVKTQSGLLKEIFDDPSAAYRAAATARRNGEEASVLMCSYEA